MLCLAAAGKSLGQQAFAVTRFPSDKDDAALARQRSVQMGM